MSGQGRKTGKLTLVATPIGNLGDISPRALETLENADLIAAEDTRHSGTLLSHFGIKKPMVSYHKYNEKNRESTLLEALQAGKDVALICDAGTPCVSDPGWIVVDEAAKNNYEIDSIPGPCAAIQALVLSGLPTDRFVFEGFLPRGNKLPPYLEELKNEPRTLIFYESPHRVKGTLEELRKAMGDDRKVAVCRELTKYYQEINRGTLREICDLWQDREIQGEFVLVLAGQAETEENEIDLKQVQEHLKRLMDGGMKHKAAAKEVAKTYDLPVNQVYEMGLELK